MFLPCFNFSFIHHHSFLSFCNLVSFSFDEDEKEDVHKQKNVIEF